mgnify:CR=1 FL=1
MIVIKINKIYQNGSISHFKVLNSDITKENIDDLVEDWCNNDHIGQVYGYTYNWEYIENKDLIKQVIINKIDTINNKIKDLKNEKNDLKNYLLNL